MKSGITSIMWRSVQQMASKPIYYIAIFVLPIFCFFFLTDLMRPGLPTRIPAAIVDRDQSPMSRQMTQSLASMQLISIDDECDDFSEARNLMQEGRIFGYFLIPENFQADLLAGRNPAITFYTNMTYYVPGTLLFKSFKLSATMAKAGVTSTLLTSAGATTDQIMPLLQPVNIVSRPLNNPELNYAIYLCNSFVPGVLQLMIFLVTCWSLGQEEKYGTSKKLMQMADGSIGKALLGKLLPQTFIWIVIAIFMESMLFGWNGYPMNGSWFWITLSEIMFVLASQGLAVFFFGLIPNLRLSLSLSALVGVLTFSIAAYSFPIQSMYGGIAIFSYILPARYNFLIYVDQALNGIDIYYSRYWYVAYLVFMLLPLTMLRRIRKAFLKPVYVP